MARCSRTTKSPFPIDPDVDAVLAFYRDMTGLARFSWAPFLNNPKLERRVHRITAPTLVVWPSGVVRRWYDGYREEARELGYVPEPEKLALSIPIYVAETDDQAHREGRQHLMWLFHKGLKQGPEIMFPPGYMTPSSMRG